MKEVKRFVVLDTGAIIDLATYGMGSCGSHDQCGAEVRGGKLYETRWIYRGDFEEYGDDFENNKRMSKK